MSEAQEIQPVILSGGVGKRLWPVSRSLYPKQFQQFGSTHSMLQDTALRVSQPPFRAPLVVCNEEHRFIVAEQLHASNVPPADIILEPESRNTAPAIAIAALWMLENTPDALMLVLPSDHAITEPTAFLGTIGDAAEHARNGRIVMFAIQPSAPYSEFGYMLGDDDVSQNDTAHRLRHFIEKPSGDDAPRLIKEGYVWNSGIYLCTPQTMLDDLTQQSPSLVNDCHDALSQGERDLDFQRLSSAPFCALQSTSIDRLVMEHTTRAVMLPLDAGWQDIRTWASLWEGRTHDENGNVIDGDVVTRDCQNSLIRSDGMVTAAIGIENMAVIVTEDAVLISDINRANDVEKLVDTFATHERTEHLYHPTIYRPWGSFHSILAAPRFQVKELMVKPGAKLSLQKHMHRAEHWIVVEGTAEVRRGEDEFLLHENQSTYIPLGTVHRLSNPGHIPLRVIEVQSGSYLGEDDIIRLEDTYGRD